MRYSLAAIIGTGTPDDPFRPPVNDEFSIIDLRPDPTVAAGWCLLAANQPGVGGLDLGDDPASRLPPGILRSLGNRLGITIDDRPLADLIAYVVAEGDNDNPRRWNGPRPTHDNKLQIRLGDISWERAIPAGGSSYTESFNKADAATLGPDLTWMETFGPGFDVVSNRASHKFTAGNPISLARAEHDLATDNHYCQTTLTITTGTVSFGGPCVRFASAADTCYFYSARVLADTAAQRIVKRVTGTETVLTTLASRVGDGSVLKITVNGSALEAFDDGASVLNTTDTSITGNTRCGIYGRADGSDRVRLDDWSAADLPIASGFVGWGIGI